MQEVQRRSKFFVSEAEDINGEEEHGETVDHSRTGFWSRKRWGLVRYCFNQRPDIRV